MSLSAYKIVVPTLLHGINVLGDYLHLARSLERSRGQHEGTLLDARLFADMLSLGEQISVVCDKVELNLMRLLGQDPTQAKKTALDYDSLTARLAKVSVMLEAISPDEMGGAETRPYFLHQPIAHGWLRGDDLIRQIVLPDFFFHLAMVHAILRHNGAVVGKKDFLGSLTLQSSGYS